MSRYSLDPGRCEVVHAACGVPERLRVTRHQMSRKVSISAPSAFSRSARSS